MMPTVVVRYQPKQGQADENQRLVEAVFSELTATTPAGLNYDTFRLADGTFVHIAEVTVAENPLTELATFHEFLCGIADRCEPGLGPNPQSATLIGSYRADRVSTII